MKINCAKCGRLVAELLPPSKIRVETEITMVCRECSKPSASSDIPDFLRDLMNGKHR